MLLVEDDVISAKSLKFLLTGRGFEVVVVTTLAEAVAALNSTNPTHVLLDLMLPDGDGITLLRMIKSQNLARWVGVLTGVSDPERLQAVNGLAPSLVLQKPVDLPALFAALADRSA